MRPLTLLAHAGVSNEVLYFIRGGQAAFQASILAIFAAQAGE